MAIIFMDGFDHYTQTDFLKKWSNTESAFQGMSTTLGRRGGGCMTYPKSTYKNLSSTYSVLIAGFAVNRPIFSTSIVYTLCYFGSGTTNYFGLFITTAGEIQVRGGTTANTLLGTTRPGLLEQDRWAYVEFKAAAAGAVEVRVNGTTELTLTGLTATSNFATFGFGFPSVSFQNPSLRIDDLYLLTPSGAANNDFLGDCRVDAYFPTSEGTTQDWTPTPAGVHYTTVDEVPISESDYVESATTSAVELFGYTDLVNTPLNVFAVQVNSAARKTDAGARSINAATRISGANYFGAAQSVSDTTSIITTVFDQNPATSSAWSRAVIDAAEFGVRIA